MATVLAFRTKPGGVSVPAGTSQELGVVNVAPFERIRVVAAERAGSGTGVTVRLMVTEGTELVAPLDFISLLPLHQETRVYEVPGTKLTAYADAQIGGTGTGALDLLVYGWKE